MSGHQLAQGVASLGRNGESMLVHMQPREVAGLQALAMQGGGSLTINPETGLPEAGWFGDILGAVAPIAAGFALGPAGFGIFESALGAGLAVGAGAFALTGDPMKGVAAGLGGYGGAGLGQSLASFGEIPQTAGVDAVTRAGITNASSIPGTVGADMLTSGAASTAGETLAGTLPYNGVVGSTGQLGADMAFKPANLIGATSNAANATSATIPQTMGEKLMVGTSKAIQHPVDFFKSGNGIMNAFTLASPLLAIQPEVPKAPEDTSYQMKYEGPYTPQDRSPRMPTAEERTRLAAEGSPEYSYFGSTNPYPGFNKYAGYAQGGVTGGGIANLYNSPDGTQAQNTLNENYGLGRLNNLASAAATEQAKTVGFDAGGTVPYMPGAPSYGITPTNLSQVAKLGQSPSDNPSSSSGLSSILGNALTDPLGRTSGQQSGMGGKGGVGGLGGQNGFLRNMFGKMRNAANPSAPLTMQDYINAANRTYDPNASISTGMDPTSAEQAQFTNINPQQPTLKAEGGGLKDGGFVIPADVVSHLGNGSTDAGLKHLSNRMNAVPIRGAGDGMSDSIRTTIEGKQPARVADGEAYIPPATVKQKGGAKNLYAMLDKVRKSRTGTTKQGKQINPNKYMMA
jgi:hypothetical protein